MKCSANCDGNCEECPEIDPEIKNSYGFIGRKLHIDGLDFRLALLEPAPRIVRYGLFAGRLISGTAIEGLRRSREQALIDIRKYVKSFYVEG